MSRIAVGCAIAFGLAFFGGAVQAETWYVRWDGQVVDAHHFATIQAALNSDLVVNADAIELIGTPFTGAGNRGVNFNGKLVTVRSQSNDPLQCTIDPELSDCGFVFLSGENGSATLQGVTIANGASQEGGGIYISASSPMIVNCRITDCYAAWGEGPGYGGGVRCVNASSPVFVNSVVSRCHVWGDRYSVSGGGLSADGSSTLTLIDCVISSNECLSDGSGNGGIECGTLMMERCRVIGNAGMYPAAGIACGSGRIEGSTIQGNAGSEGAGGIFAGSLIIENSLITGNFCHGVGGVLGTALTIRGSTVSGNSGSPGGHGGVEGDQVDLERTILWGNCRSDGNGTLTLTCCAFDPAKLEGTIIIVGPQVNEDPLFCDPVPCEDAPSAGGDYALRAGSPCLPGGNPCGDLIGALGEGCQPTATEPTTWGRIKSGFHGPKR